MALPTLQVRGNTINRDLISSPVQDLKVKDSSGKVIGEVKGIDLQPLVTKLAVTNPVGGTYAQLQGAPTLTNTTQRIVSYPVTTGTTAPIIRGQLEIFVSTFNIEHYVIQYALTSLGNIQQGTLSMTGASTSNGLSPPLVNTVKMQWFAPAGVLSLVEILIGFSGNPSMNNANNMGTSLFWAPAPIPPMAGNGTNVAGDVLPTLGWAAATASPTSSLTLSTNNASFTYSFACISSHSSSQTSFL